MDEDIYRRLNRLESKVIYWDVASFIVLGALIIIAIKSLF